MIGDEQGSGMWNRGSSNNNHNIIDETGGGGYRTFTFGNEFEGFIYGIYGIYEIYHWDGGSLFWIWARQ